MSRPENITKVEAANRKKEAKRKKVDYRKWANKYLAPGSLPLKLAGLGEGTINYCPKCDLACRKSVRKDKWYCGDCGTETVIMTKREFEDFKKAQSDKNTDKHDRE